MGTKSCPKMPKRYQRGTQRPKGTQKDPNMSPKGPIWAQGDQEGAKRDRKVQSGPKWPKMPPRDQEGSKGVHREPGPEGYQKWLNALEWFLSLIDFSFVLNAIGGFLTTCTGCLVAKGDSVVVVCCVGGSALC